MLDRVEVLDRVKAKCNLTFSIMVYTYIEGYICLISEGTSNVTTISKDVDNQPYFYVAWGRYMMG